MVVIRKPTIHTNILKRFPMALNEPTECLVCEHTGEYLPPSYVTFKTQLYDEFNKTIIKNDAITPLSSLCNKKMHSFFISHATLFERKISIHTNNVVEDLKFVDSVYFCQVQ